MNITDFYNRTSFCRRMSLSMNSKVYFVCELSDGKMIYLDLIDMKPDILSGDTFVYLKEIKDEN